MSKNVQTEYKAKARFLALLRCNRFSRRSLKLALSINFRHRKSTNKKIPGDAKKARRERIGE
jgi:hypothetical protein